MYQKYYTDALVLSHRERGEADRVYALYTKEFGLLRARCTAVRRENSRMRYALQSGALASVGLVRGARGWRVAGASARACVSSPGALEVFARASRLVERLVAGEEQNEYLFCALSEAHAALRRASASLYPGIELICVARTLYALGYLSKEAVSSALFARALYGEEELAQAERERERILVLVNNAIEATHL